MTTCSYCKRESDVTELVRHEHDGMLFVHCPHCNHVLGVYNEHRQHPETDLLAR